MNLLLVTNEPSDMTAVLAACPVSYRIMTFDRAIHTDISDFDCYYVSCDGVSMDARLRFKLEAESARGKRLLLENPNSWLDIYSGEPVPTVRSRLVCVADGLGGLTVGDLLDDGSNQMRIPYYTMKDSKPLLVYRDYIIAHRHMNAPVEEIMADSRAGIWQIGQNTVMSSFNFRFFRRARYAPKKSWEDLISYLAAWLTGVAPVGMPDFGVSYGFGDADLSDGKVFENAVMETVRRGIECLKRYLVDNGEGGITEGLQHDVLPDGTQLQAVNVRTDCTGEAAGAFRFYAEVGGCEEAYGIAERLQNFVYGPMQIKGGLFDGMLRWTAQAWMVCYPDDVCRALLPTLYNCILFGDGRRLPEVKRALDFLVRTTAKDGLHVSRTDCINMTEKTVSELASAGHGTPSAHYNAYYHAALLLAYQVLRCDNYLDTAVSGLETLMGMYPDTQREQSETEEMCRLVLPLAILYETTKKEEHRQMLYRVTDDLKKLQYPCGGFAEWDTGYQASCSRLSRGECSVLTQNGDPVADMLYSANWLPLGFAWAYRATADPCFENLWTDVVKFCIRSQISSDNRLLDGCWCRAFDLQSMEAYAAPHDAGWGPLATETGWTDSEILMGIMAMDIFRRKPNGPQATGTK